MEIYNAKKKVIREKIKRKKERGGERRMKKKGERKRKKEGLKGCVFSQIYVERY